MNKIKALLADKYFFILFLVFIVLVFLLPQGGYIYDQAFWYSWTVRIKEVGLTNIYQFSDVNYMPFFLYVLDGFGKIFTTPELIWNNLHLLKILVLAFDISSIYLVIKMFQKLNIQGSKAFFILFNIAFLYNTLFWGQVDGIFVFFVVCSIILALYNKTKLSLLIFLLAVNVKLQAVIYAPLILLLTLPALWKNKRAIFEVIIWGVLMQIILLLPFLAAGKFPEIVNVITSSAGFYQKISFNAFNFWYLLLGPAKAMGSNQDLLLGLSYSLWGMVLFLISFVASIYPIFKHIKENFKAKHPFQFNKAFVAKVFLSAGMIALSFFFFSTEMHERYIHAAIIMFGVYALVKGRYFMYVLISLAYFLNLENVLNHLTSLDHSLPIFATRFIASLYAIVVVCGFISLYEEQIKKRIPEKTKHQLKKIFRK